MNKKSIITIFTLIVFLGIFINFPITNKSITTENKETLAYTYEGLYTNTIYYKNVNTEKYEPANGLVTLDVNSELELVAVLDGYLNMNGSVPSTENYSGSGFWSNDPVPVTNEWTNLGNNKWLVKYVIQLQGVGQFGVSLAKNGNGYVSSTTIKVEYNKIKLANIEVGSQSYANVDKHVATKMFNGKNSGNNSASNRFATYIGESITVTAIVPEGYSLELDNTNSLSVKEASTYSDGKVTATFTGINPGDNQIYLKDENQNIVEVFFVQTRYPIYVNTEMGEIFKDYIHEYLKIALESYYNSNTDAVVTNTELVPQYVKNGWDYYRYYYLFGDNTVELVTYVSADDTRDFEMEGDLEMSDHKVETVTTGDKAGFKRISAKYKVIVPESGGLVKIGYDNFIMAHKGENEKVHHFDLETVDGGTGTIVKNQEGKDGLKIVTETIYSARITEIHEANVYSATDKLITLQKNEFWQTFPEEHTQYESTSAYITNENGNLVDFYNNVIDDAFRAGYTNPTQKIRDITLKDIDKVEFKVNVEFDPVKKVTKTYKKGTDGNYELTDTKEEDITGGEKLTYTDYTLEMNHTQMLDAYNKCPFHTGLDFTLKLVMFDSSNQLLVPDTLKNASIGIAVVAVLIAITSGIIIAIHNKKKNNE